MGKASRRKQELYQGVDGQGRPLFPQAGSAAVSLLGVPVSWVLAVVAASLWVGAHLPEPIAPLAGVGYLISAIALGLLNPALGAGFAIVLVPYLGGNVSQGLGELLRTAPIIGAAIRLLVDRFNQRRGAGTPWAPDWRIVAAAVAAMMLYPLTRLTANGSKWATSNTLLDDTLFLIGAPVAMYAAWITFSHLPRSAINRVLSYLPVALTVALVVALAAWVGVSLVDPLTFRGVVYGRLAGLGFPTPTAMGVAITLPLAVGLLWGTSRRWAAALALLGVLVIVLTESRGPLLALFAAGATALLLLRGLQRRVIVAALVFAALALVALLMVRYPDLIGRLSSGTLPNLESDALRVISWVAAIQIVLANPITGGGWMSVRGWNDRELGRENVNLSHNVFLQGLADGGVPLGVAIGTVLLSSARSAWSRRHEVPVYWVAAAVALFVCGAWDMPQLRSFAALMGGLALGLVSRHDVPDEPEVS